MTLDEEIKHCEEVAEKYCEKVEEGLTADDFCDSCASEHRQLAEWLRQLSEIRHLFNVTEKLYKANFRGGLIDVVDSNDILFSEHKQLREIFEEVKADEDSD